MGVLIGSQSLIQKSNSKNLNGSGIDTSGFNSYDVHTNFFPIQRQETFNIAPDSQNIKEPPMSVSEHSSLGPLLKKEVRKNDKFHMQSVSSDQKLRMQPEVPGEKPTPPESRKTKKPDEESSSETPVKQPVEKKAKVCLTFDDGPNSGTNDVLSALGDSTPATFFVIGNKINESTSPLVKRMNSMSNIQIGNHTISHTPLKVHEYKAAFGDLSTKEQQDKFKEWFDLNSRRLKDLGVDVKLARLPGGGTLWTRKPEILKGARPDKPDRKSFESETDYSKALEEYKKYTEAEKAYKKEKKRNIRRHKKMLELIENKEFGLGLKHVLWNAEFTTVDTPGFKNCRYKNWQKIENARSDTKGFPKGILLFHDSHWKGKVGLLRRIINKLKEKRAIGQLNDRGECT